MENIEMEFEEESDEPLDLRIPAVILRAGAGQNQPAMVEQMHIDEVPEENSEQPLDLRLPIARLRAEPTDNTVQHVPRFTELPGVVLENIYKCLPQNDLFSVRDVCQKWKTATEKTSVWKRFPSEISAIGNDVNDMSRVPYLHRIEGVSDNTDVFVNDIVNNYSDLKEIDMLFETPLNVNHIQNIVNKFPNLESISIYPVGPDILESLAVLQNCERLKEVLLDDFPQYFLLNHKLPLFSAICNIKSLSSLRLNDYFHPHIEISDILLLLHRKMKDLESLSLCVRYRSEQPYFNEDIMLVIISQSKKLKEFDFQASVDFFSHIYFNFADMNVLRTLKLKLISRSRLNAMPEVSFPYALNTIEISLLGISNTHRILENIIKSCPNLVNLKICNSVENNINDQLKNLNTLPNLASIKISSCNFFSSAGMEHISKCMNLRSLELVKILVHGSAFCFFKNCKYLKILDFFRCKITQIENLLPTMLVLKYLTHVYIVECKSVTVTGTFELHEEFFQRYITRCRAREHNVNILTDY